MADTFTDGARRTRAKVYVAEVTNFSGYQGPVNKALPSARVTLKFVNGNDPDSENAKFWDATPTAEPILMTIVNPASAAVFKAGDEFYLDFIEAIRTPTES